MMSEGGMTVADRATYGFYLFVSRPPSQSEINGIISFYNRQLKKSRDNAAELSAWTMVANVLLNMDETISKE
jgi:hypothetical protein